MMGQIEEISLLVENEKYEEALAAIDGLDEAQRKQHEILNLLSIIGTSCQNWKLAEYYCQEALKQAPDNPDYVYNLAGVCYAAGKYREGVDVIENFSTSDMEIKEEMNLLKEELLQAMAGSRKVLMAAYYFPPLGGSGVYRSLKFARYLPENNWFPTVISAANPPAGWNFRDDSMVDEIPETVEIHRIKDELTTAGEYMMGEDEAEGMLRLLDQIFMLDMDAYNIFAAILNSPDGRNMLLQFPCTQLNWAWKVINYIEENISLENYQAVFTTSGPYSGHLIGCYLKKKYGIPWIADFRDEWINNPYGELDIQHNLFHRLLYHLEKLIVTTADHVICVSEPAEKNYLNTYPINAEQITEITNGYDENDFSDVEFNTIKNPKFRISYTGLLYSKERSILPVLKAISKLIQDKKVERGKIEIILMGNNYLYDLDKINALDLNDIIRTVPYSEHKEAIRLSVSSDLLLCLVGDGKKYDTMYPIKFFEYLRCGKPVLSLSPIHGFLDRILRMNHLGIAVPSTSSAGIYNFIFSEYRKWDQNPLNTRNIPADIKSFERHTLASALAGVMNQVVEKQTVQKEIPSTVYDLMYAGINKEHFYNQSYRDSHYYPSWIRAVRYLIFLSRDTKILDIGCGVGQFANMLFDYGFTNYKGLDFSEEAIAIARKRNQSYSHLFTVGNAFESNIFDEDYDLVIFFEILEHIQKDLLLLERVKSGKRIMFSVPNFSDKNHVRFFDTDKQVLERYGKLIEIQDIQEIKVGTSNILYLAAGMKR